MVNRDIVFSLDREFRHEFYDLKDVFYTREYIYNFEFSFHINNNDVPVNSINIYKNGILYKDCQVFQNSNNDYQVKDDNWIKYGNNNFAVEIILEGGRIYKNDFYLKVLNGYSQDDLDIESFSTYGLHENFSPLNVILRVNTQQTIDRVLLYYHISPNTQINGKSYISPESATAEHYDSKDIKWSYLGQMELKNQQYQFTHLIFDTTMQEQKSYLYKAVIVTNSEFKKQVSMNTVIKPNSFSLNTIQYRDAETKQKGYDIYGGIVGRIMTSLDDPNGLNPMFNDKLFEMVIDKTDTCSYLTIDIDGCYHFIAEKYHVDYMRRVYTKNQTDRDPNYFEIYGDGMATYVIDENRNIYQKDNCRFTMKLICGDNIYVSFDIKPLNDASLAVRTEKTANNVIRYKAEDKVEYLDSVAEDKTVSANSTEGHFKYSKDDKRLLFVDSKTEQETNVAITMYQKYFDECDYCLYNSENFYFIRFNEYGINVVKYDGINFDEVKYKTSLTNQTLNFVKKNNVVCFDKDDNLFIRFINTDGTNVLEKVIVEKNELKVIDCSEMVVMAYNDLRKKIFGYINNIEYVKQGTINYFITSDSNDYSTIERVFDSCGYDDYNLKFSVQELTFKLSVPIKVQFREPASNVIITFRTDMNIDCKSDVLFYDDNYVIGNPRINYNIDCDTLKYSYTDKGLNLIAQTGYEKLNGKWFLRFSNAMKSYTKDDYADFKQCTLYLNSSRIYNLKPEDVYGKGTKRTTFMYRDLCRMRAIRVEYNLVDLMLYKDGELLITRINTELKQQVSQKTEKTHLFYEKYNAYTAEQLMTFETLLMQAHQYKKTERTMYIYTISDRDSVSVGGITSKWREMQPITSISSTPDKVRNSFMLSYTYQYPLNIKNRQNYLKDLYIRDQSGE